MSTFSDFYDDIFPQVPGAANALVDKTIRDIMIDFWTRTHIQREELPDISVVSGTSTYTLVSSDPTNLEPFDVSVARLVTADVTLSPTSEYELDSYVNDWGSKTGTPAYYMLIHGQDMRLYPSPTASDTLKVTAYVKPSQTATTFNTKIVDRYRPHLLRGVIGSLLLMNDVPWRDPVLGRVNMMLYESAVVEADFTRKVPPTQTLRVKPKRFL